MMNASFVVCVQALELVVGVDDLALKRRKSGVEALFSRRAATRQGRQDFGQAGAFQ